MRETGNDGSLWMVVRESPQCSLVIFTIIISALFERKKITWVIFLHIFLLLSYFLLRLFNWSCMLSCNSHYSCSSMGFCVTKVALNDLHIIIFSIVSFLVSRHCLISSCLCFSFVYSLSTCCVCLYLLLYFLVHSLLHPVILSPFCGMGEEKGIRV